MPRHLQCKTRLECNPKLRKDYSLFFYDKDNDKDNDKDYHYKYYFYMRELRGKIKRKEIKKYDDIESERKNSLQYKDLFDKERKPMSPCNNGIFFMIQIMTCLISYNMYNNFGKQYFGSNLNETIFSRI